MDDPQTVSLYLTAADAEQAEQLAEALLAERLVACVNVLPGVTSLYRWEGRLVRDDEVVLVAKTARDRVDAAVARVAAIHPYDVPCVVVLPHDGGLDAYRAWVCAETRPGGD